MPKDSEGKQKYGHTSPFQLRAMVEWIEVKENYDIIKGESTKGKTIQHGGAVTRISGYGRMAEYVFKKAKKYAKAAGKMNDRHSLLWPAETCQNRWKSMRLRYTKVNIQLKNQTGFGITEAMMKAGMTLEKMVEKACPFFYRIDAVIGRESTVEPPAQQHQPILSGDEQEETNGPNAGAVSPENDDDNARDDGDENQDDDENEEDQDDDEDDEDQDILALVDAGEESDDSVVVSSAPALASVVEPLTGRRTAQAKGVAKAQEAKRKDFGSVYVAAASDRLRFEKKKLQVEMNLRQRQHQQDVKLREEELRLKAQQQRDALVQKRDEERNKLILQLLQGGMAVEQVKTTVDSFFPPPAIQDPNQAVV